MRQALVLGASGGMGSSIVNELIDREIKVTAFVRNQSKLNNLFHENKNITICPGDIFSKEQLEQAVGEAGVIFHAIGLPYTDWETKLPAVTKNMLRFVGLFNRQMRELVELQYLNEDPVVLNGEKYEKNIGPVPKTSYEKGLKETIASYDDGV